jgi:hypothetical protein
LEILAQALDDIAPLQLEPGEYESRRSEQTNIELTHTLAIQDYRADVTQATSGKTSRRRFSRRRAALISKICKEDKTGSALHWFEVDLDKVSLVCEWAEVSECAIYRQVWTRMVLAGKISARIAEITLKLARGMSLREVQSIPSA